MNDLVDIKLDIPQPKLSNLSFADTNVQAINQWAGELPLVNTPETATQLNLAMAEVAELDAEPQAKLEYLEALRPLAHYICARLDRTSMNKSGASTLQAQSLLQNLTQGYKSVFFSALDAQRSAQKTPAKDVLPIAIHRLLSDWSRISLRALQFHVALPNDFWSNLHSVYSVAKQLALCQFTLADDENHNKQDLTIEAAYLRTLLINSCKPNQLQQQQLANVFSALEVWAEHVTLDKQTADAFLVVDLAKNTGPQYASLSDDLKNGLGLHTEILAYEIDAYLSDVNNTLAIPDSLENPLLRQLAESWSVVKPRAFRRSSSELNIRLCVGLSAVHYFLSGGVEFAEQLTNADAPLRREVNPFLDVDYEPAHREIDSDPWSQAHDLKNRIPENPNIESPERILLEAAKLEDKPVRHYDHFETQTLDTSPGGYRIKWSNQTPNQTQVGELVALREDSDSRWCVAVIRWIQHDDTYASMGLELIAPRAIPVAVRAIQRTGGPTDYTRALLLPGLDAIKQPATLITPTVPFTQRQKVHIQRQGIQTTGQLLDYRLKSQSFNQFTFRMLDGYLENS